MRIEGLTGEVITSKDKNYNKLRRDFNLCYNYYPKYIVYPSETKDIINAINYSRKNNINIRIRNGGHNYESFSVANDSMVIDVSNLVDFNIDEENNTVTIGAGLRLGDLYKKLAKYNYAFVGGSCLTVGVTGLTLGGGVGYLQRAYGLSCDNLLEIELVDCFGKVVISNLENNNRLFSALRGAGGNNFGVVTILKFKIYPIDFVISISVKWPKENRYEVINKFQQIAENLDNRITIKLVITANDITLSGLGITTLDEVINELNDILTVENEEEFNIEEISFLDFVVKNGGDIKTGAPFKTTGKVIYKPLSYEACNLIFHHLDKLHHNKIDTNVGLLLLGGKVKDNDFIDDGFAHRKALFIFQIDSKWSENSNEQDKKNIGLVNKFSEDMNEYTNGGYVNYCDINVENYLEYYYGEKYLKLKEIKEIYNPTKLFDFQQGL